jgi:hypothetical protein
MELNERLIAARKHAQFETASEAAHALGVRYSTYAGHENGNSGFKASTGELYARRFKVRFEWLMNGRGPMVDLSSKHEEILQLYDSLSAEDQETYARILRRLARQSLPAGRSKEDDQAAS